MSGGRTTRGRSRKHPIATIGYEGVTQQEFLTELQEAGIELLVDVRAVSSSRRPGFSKSRLRESLAGAGIEYLHLRGLGTPPDGRAAAKSGRHQEMRRIYLEHLETDEAHEDLDALQRIVESGKHACLLCFEARPEHCHRSIVVERLQGLIDLEVRHLGARRVDDRHHE